MTQAPTVPPVRPATPDDVFEHLDGIPFSDRRFKLNGCIIDLDIETENVATAFDDISDARDNNNSRLPSPLPHEDPGLNLLGVTESFPDESYWLHAWSALLLSC